MSDDDTFKVQAKMLIDRFGGLLASYLARSYDRAKMACLILARESPAYPIVCDRLGLVPVIDRNGARLDAVYAVDAEQLRLLLDEASTHPASLDSAWDDAKASPGTVVVYILEHGPIVAFAGLLRRATTDAHASSTDHRLN